VDGTTNKSGAIDNDSAADKRWARSSDKKCNVATKPTTKNCCLAEMAKCNVNICHQDFCGVAPTMWNCGLTMTSEVKCPHWA
jgi:hypothetical protein